MRKTKIQKRVEEIVDQISALEDELEVLQAKCKHKNATKEYGSNTGGYDPSEDCHWIRYECPRCQKIWRDYSK